MEEIRRQAKDGGNMEVNMGGRKYRGKHWRTEEVQNRGKHRREVLEKLYTYSCTVVQRAGEEKGGDREVVQLYSLRRGKYRREKL